MILLKQWAITTMAMLVATHVLSGIRYETVPELFIATLALVGLNMLFGGVKMFLGCFSLGLVAFLMNALLLLLVAKVVPGFEVDGFGTAFFGGLIVSVLTIACCVATHTPLPGSSGRMSVRVSRGGASRPEHRRNDDDGGGPIIDV